MAIGNAMGLHEPATSGIVSGLNRVLPLSTMSYLEPFIQTDAAINPGNSGGPLVTKSGEVVGINTMMLRDAQTTGFAIPANLLKQVIPELVEHGKVMRPWHGLYGQMMDPILADLMKVPVAAGFLIEKVEPGCPVEKIGLRGGALPIQMGMQTLLLGVDVITEIDEKTPTDMREVLALVAGLKLDKS
jgi:serine protease Do